MNNVQIKIDEAGNGAFVIIEEEEQLGEMVFQLKDHTLTVFHTEVVEKAEGKGLAKDLLNNMVDYARAKSLKVIPLCPYVHLQFRRHAEKYGDIWMKNE